MDVFIAGIDARLIFDYHEHNLNFSSDEITIECRRSLELVSQHAKMFDMSAIKCKMFFFYCLQYFCENVNKGNCYLYKRRFCECSGVTKWSRFLIEKNISLKIQIVFQKIEFQIFVSKKVD